MRLEQENPFAIRKCWVRDNFKSSTDHFLRCDTVFKTASFIRQTSVTWYRSPRIFQQPRSHLRILGARRETKSNIHAVNPNTIGTTIQNVSHPSNLAPVLIFTAMGNLTSHTASCMGYRLVLATALFIHTASTFTFCKIPLSETLEDNSWTAYNTLTPSHAEADFTWRSKIRLRFWRQRHLNFSFYNMYTNISCKINVQWSVTMFLARNHSP
jgi:hypothetical protein